MSKIVPDYLQGWKLVPDDNYEQVCTNELIVTTGSHRLSDQSTGEWFDSANKWDVMANKHNFFCQKCKRFAMYFVSGTEDWWCHEAPNYCPNCGARMEKNNGEL